MIHPDLLVVDENDNVTDAAPFDEVYKKGLHHRISRIIVEDGRGNMLLQKRGPNVKLYPNTWDVAAAGHVDIGEDYLSAAKRELKEEVGLTVEPVELGKIEVHKIQEGRIINRFIMYYKVTISQDAKLEVPKDEVSEVKWFSVNEIMRMRQKEPNTLADGLTDALVRFY